MFVYGHAEITGPQNEAPYGAYFSALWRKVQLAHGLLTYLWKARDRGVEAFSKAERLSRALLHLIGMEMPR
jgi:hypothetical protein